MASATALTSSKIGAGKENPAAHSLHVKILVVGEFVAGLHCQVEALEPSTRADVCSTINHTLGSSVAVEKNIQKISLTTLFNLSISFIKYQTFVRNFLKIILTNCF